MTNAPDFDARLDRLAEVAVRVGLGLRPGQELVMTAPLDALPLARRITVQAYKAGASVVTTLLADDQATLARFEHGHDDAFDKAAGWLYEGMASAYRSGAARLAISGDDPSLLAGQDPDKVARANRAGRRPTCRRSSRSPISPPTGPSSRRPIPPGPARCSPTSRGPGRRPAVGRDLCRLAGRRAGSGRRLGGA